MMVIYPESSLEYMLSRPRSAPQGTGPKPHRTVRWCGAVSTSQNRTALDAVRIGGSTNNTSREIL